VRRRDRPADRESQSESAVITRRRTVRLTKTIKHPGQELSRDSLPAIFDSQLDVFVWLSVQSVVVVATAIWFRSRLIVVANFAIFLAIVLGYVVLVPLALIL